ncbi:MAG: DUF4388 domain-containing protein [Geobacter sp.]|nr:DUF4388 domain-containing protein [Geobacter sp.]
MSFVGDLEHLPIVDVIQLLHSTRKSGTLCLKSQRGESHLVFKDGYIVSANHANTGIRVGRILVEMQAITEDDLQEALQTQQNAGADRIPLIATLLESGKIKEEVAHRGLESLVELTIVEVLTWTGGTFELDIDQLVVSDEYRYFPETLQQEIYINTQSVLMDALRIYDERMRDGTLTEETFAVAELPTGQTAAVTASQNWEITADDLGLEDLDSIQRKIPDVFLGVKEYDPAKAHLQKIREELREYPRTEQDKLFSFLEGLTGSESAIEPDKPAPAVILFSSDEFIRQAVMSVCRAEGYFTFTTDEEVNLDHIIGQTLAKELIPILVVDQGSSHDGATSRAKAVTFQQEKLGRYPDIIIVQMVPTEERELSLQLLQAGASCVLMRPDREKRKETFVDDTVSFLQSFLACMQQSVFGSERLMVRRLKDYCRQLDTMQEAPDVALLMLRFVSSSFERAVTLVVGKEELLAERGIGITGDKAAGVTPPLRFKIPLGQPTLILDVLASGTPYFGPCNDAVLCNHLHAEIGSPRYGHLLLMPLKSFGKVIALTYADFGAQEVRPVRIDPLEILARQAGLVLENAFYRKRFEKQSQKN